MEPTPTPPSGPFANRPYLREAFKIGIAVLAAFLAARYGIVIPQPTQTTVVVQPDGKAITTTAAPQN